MLQGEAPSYRDSFSTSPQSLHFPLLRHIVMHDSLPKMWYKLSKTSRMSASSTPIIMQERKLTI